MMDDFSLARPAGHLIMGDGSGPDGLATKDGAKALSGAESVDTATTQVGKASRTKNLITELIREHVEREEVAITGSAQGSEHLSLLLLGDIQYGCARHRGLLDT
jgi:hypothetical protein